MCMYCIYIYAGAVAAVLGPEQPPLRCRRELGSCRLPSRVAGIFFLFSVPKTKDMIWLKSCLSGCLTLNQAHTHTHTHTFFSPPSISL